MTEAQPLDPPGASRGHAIAFGLVAVACLFFAVRSWNKSLRPQGTDFTIYLDAGRAVLDGELPSGVEDYIYPPLFAVAFAPLALLPLSAASLLWQLLNLGLVLWCARAAARIATERGPPAPWLYWAPLLFLLRLADSNFANGQVNIVVLTTIVIGLLALKDGREARAGVAFGLGAALKVLPGVFLLWLLLKRRWRGVWAGGASLLLFGVAVPCLALGPRDFASDVHNWLAGTAAPYVRGGQALLDEREYLPGQSLYAAGYRLLTDSAATHTGKQANIVALDPDTARLVVIGLIALQSLAVFVRVARRRWAPGTVGWTAEAGLIVCWVLASAPLVHKAHMIWLIVPVAVLLKRCLATEGPRARRLEWALTIFGLASIALTTPALVGRVAATRFLSHNTIFFGLEALLAASWLAARPHSDSRRSVTSGPSSEAVALDSIQGHEDLDAKA